MEWRWKDLKELKATISQYEDSLRRARVPLEETLASRGDQSNTKAKGAMAITSVADDTPPVSTMPEPSTAPPGEEQTHSMEVDDEDDCQPPASPVFHMEDKLLMGGDVVGVEGSHLLKAVMAVMRVPPFRRPIPLTWPPPTYLCEALQVNASRTSMKKVQNSCIGKAKDGTLLEGRGS